MFREMQFQLRAPDHQRPFYESFSTRDSPRVHNVVAQAMESTKNAEETPERRTLVLFRVWCILTLI